MAEYGTRIDDGEQIKIGTCEDMLYLRPDQIDQVTAPILQPHILPKLRFRFPFPDEDTTRPGEFNDPDRDAGVYGILPPVGIEHARVQFASTYPPGHNVTLPCPMSLEGKASGLTYQPSGFGAPVRIIQQRIFAGVWVLVAKCGGCASAYRLETLEDAQPVIAACRQRAIHDSRGGEDTLRQAWWTKVAGRIEQGYRTPAPPPLTAL
jgi:hypothetical protein